MKLSIEGNHMNIHRNPIFFIIITWMIFLTGCGKAFVIREPLPSSIKYTRHVTKLSGLKVIDTRTGEDKILSVGAISARLIGIDDEISFLGKNIIKALQSRGVTIKPNLTVDNNTIELKVRKFQIRNSRSTNLSPYYTFTTFSGDLIYGGKTERITAYFKVGKMPVWSFREVEEPCYNIPLSLTIKEIATKINNHLFGLSSTNDKVESLAQEISTKIEKYTYLKVLELGYTNNPTAIAHLVKLISHENNMISATAISALGMLQAVDQFELLKTHYATFHNTKKFMALKSIGDLGTNASRSFILSVKKSEDYSNDMIKEVVDLYL